MRVVPIAAVLLMAALPFGVQAQERSPQQGGIEPSVPYARGGDGLLEPSGQGQVALRHFNRIDAAGNGYITLGDLTNTGVGATMFLLLDRNGDGQLTFQEFAPHGGETALSYFQAWDLNGDEVLTMEEFPVNLPPGTMAIWDRTGNGQIALTELRPEFAAPRTVERRDRPSPAPVQDTARRAPAQPCQVMVPSNGGSLPVPVARRDCR
ncbi:EF-hand domain-containing protein [Telmatospirillum sp. J64-1]|uniref:EF-hand domain-containing protein n=1 Tax=Telmatospirillum sp. J64-1 TaxID=2502183 RepID=UPI00115DA474|nr:EF-hand domain-containing protein [Telmatospirillum sp. J64-1]